MSWREKMHAQVAFRGFVAMSLFLGSGCSDDGAATQSEDAGSPPLNASTSEMRSSSGTRVASAAEGCDAVDLAPPAEGEGIQLSIELDLEPGKERQVCRLARLDKAINVNRVEGRHTRGSHHGFTTKTSYHGEYPHTNLLGEMVDDPTTTHDCESSGSNWDDKGVLAYSRQVGSDDPTGKGLLPNDVAIKLAADDIVQLNFHMINLSDKPFKACYKQNLYGIPDKQVRAEAGTIFWYNPYVTVPANGSASATMACPITEDIMLADQVSHMHKRGISYSAMLHDGDPTHGGKAMQTLYQGTAWEDPIEQINTPALQLKKGQWVRFTCNYENPENRNVAQGLWTSDEMCMFIGTYWPRSEEMDSCAVERQRGRIMADGNKSATELAACWQNSPKTVYGGGPTSAADRYQTQKCITDSCTNVSAHSNEILSGKLDPKTIDCE